MLANYLVAYQLPQEVFLLVTAFSFGLNSPVYRFGTIDSPARKKPKS